MATTYKDVVTTGPVSWARIFEGNRDMTGYQDAYVDHEGSYTVNQQLDKEQFEKLKKAGSMKKPIQSHMMDGKIVVKFERKHIVKSGKGEIIAKAGGAPVVVKADGTPWDTETDGLIGNGTIAEVTNLIQTFDVTNDKGNKEKASRTSLAKVKILDLVEYVKEDN